MGPHGQNRIEHQHALLRPFCQAAVAWDRATQVVMQLLIDIHQ